MRLFRAILFWFARIRCCSCGDSRWAVGSWQAGWRFVTQYDSTPQWQCRNCHRREAISERQSARWM